MSDATRYRVGPGGLHLDGPNPPGALGLDDERHIYEVDQPAMRAVDSLAASSIDGRRGVERLIGRNRRLRAPARRRAALPRASRPARARPRAPLRPRRTDPTGGHRMIDARFTPMPAWPHGDTWDRRSRFTFKAGWSNTLELLDRELRLLDAENVLIGVNLQPRHIRLDGWPRGDAPQPAHPGVEISFNSGAIARLDPTVRRGLELVRRAGGDQRAALRRAHPDAGGDHADFVAIQAALDPTKRLVYATDVCDYWQHNVRSIALGLEALRAVDRYGISRRGEQYAGFRAALTTGKAA